MFGILTIISIIFTIKEIIKEKTEKPVPPNQRFDWEAYWEDIDNGIGAMEQVKKKERGGYNTIKPSPPKWYELPIDTVIDTKRYEHDKEVCGEYMAEIWRKNGRYRQIIKY